MLAPAFPVDEENRLASLRDLNILDTPPEDRFDRLTRITQRIFDLPIALVTLIDSERQWFKSCIGLDITETPRSISFCGHAILNNEALVIPDVALDPRFFDNPLVTGKPYVRFYAGQPLKANNGSRMGTLCILDKKPRQISQTDLNILRDLATLVENELNFSASLEARDLQLRESEERWKFAMDGAGHGMWDWNPQTDIAVYSKRWKEMLGYVEKEFPNTGAAWVEHLHTDDKDRVMSAVQASFVGDTPHYSHEFRMRCKGGSWKWILSRGKLISRNRSGYPLRMIGTHTDITERKQADEQLRIAATAFDSQEGMVVTDANGVILRVNRAFTELTGYTADEVVGQAAKIPKSVRQSTQLYQSIQETVERTGKWRGEVWDRRKNGEEYPQWLTISAVMDDSGAVTHFVSTLTDITERKIAEEKVVVLAYFDQLTGLPNKRLLQDRLGQILTASARDDSYGALLFIDLDNFKTINDTLGHNVGDLLLKDAGQRLKMCVREGDTVARLGGDEFVLALRGLSNTECEAAKGAEIVARKALDTLGQPYTLGDASHGCTASIGVTMFKGHLCSIEDLMKQADLAMYRSKGTGRNKLHFFNLDMENAVKNRIALEKDLREAVQEKQFMLYYQAQVVNEGHLTGAEVLLRWQHPQRGIVSPAEFIPLAEETGLILPLGLWVLETACTQLASWAAQPHMAHLTVSVNVSAHQFGQSDFVNQVLAVLSHTGANPQRLKLELTESLLIGNVQNIVEKMFTLKAKGISFSLDDFGTGYSSLYYLKKLPLEQLKIDQSFVRDLLNDPNDAAIVRTIIALSQSLGFNVVAEGVETAAQRDFLAHAGCLAYQGYFFSRPLPLVDFESYACKS